MESSNDAVKIAACTVIVYLLISYGVSLTYGQDLFFFFVFSAVVTLSLLADFLSFKSAYFLFVPLFFAIVLFLGNLLFQLLEKLHSKWGGRNKNSVGGGRCIRNQ